MIAIKGQPLTLGTAKPIGVVAQQPPNDSEDKGAASQGKSSRSRTVLVGFLGSVVRRMDNWMPISGVVALMGQIGIDESSVRTAVFRLKQRGWLTPDRHNSMRGYRLTSVALASCAAGDEIVWHARQPANLSDGWCIVNFSVPESDRSRRHQLRAHLASLGFGNIGAGVWIAPAQRLDAAIKAIEELDLAAQSAVFVGRYAGGENLKGILRAGWDLDEINGRYKEFVNWHEPDLLRFEASRDAISDEDAFVTYVNVIDHWRKLPFRDPGLPRELLGSDWAAGAAGAVFERLVVLLEEPALGHASTYWGEVPSQGE